MVLPKAGVSSEISTKEGPASKIIWIVAGFSFLQPVGLNVSVPCWLLAMDYPQFLFDCWLSVYCHVSLPCMASGFIKVSKGESQ